MFVCTFVCVLLCVFVCVCGTVVEGRVETDGQYAVKVREVGRRGDMVHLQTHLNTHQYFMCIFTCSCMCGFVAVDDMLTPADNT